MAVLTDADGARGGGVLHLLQRAAGLLYLVAGVAKPVPNLVAPGVPEDVGVVLRAAATANVGTPLEALSAWLVTVTPLVIVVVTVAMVSLGIVFLVDGPLLRLAAAGNVAMLACFALVLGRHDPWLPLVDGLLAVLAALIFVRAGSWRARHPHGAVLGP